MFLLRLALRNAFLRRGYEVSLAGSPVEAETAAHAGKCISECFPEANVPT